MNQKNTIFEKSFHEFLKNESFDPEASDFMDAIIYEMETNPHPSQTMMEGWAHDLRRIKQSIHLMERKLNEGK